MSWQKRTLTPSDPPTALASSILFNSRYRAIIRLNYSFQTLQVRLNQDAEQIVFLYSSSRLLGLDCSMGWHPRPQASSSSTRTIPQMEDTTSRGNKHVRMQRE